MSVTVHHGDCLDVLRGMDEASVDSVVTDPPYGLEFMSVGWDTFATPKGGARSDADFGDYGSKEHPRDARGQARVMRNKSRAFGQWCEAWAREVYRVMKPGAFAVICGGTRTYHRMVCAVEDAGFEIRDQLSWIYGSGFCKTGYIRDPSTKEIVREGWAGSLKPAHEPIVLARKPLACPTVAANVLQYGTGALHIDACRVTSSVGQLPNEDGTWGRDESLCASCAALVDESERPTAPATEASTAIRRAEPTSSARDEIDPGSLLPNSATECCGGLPLTAGESTNSSTAEFGKTPTGLSRAGKKSTTSTATSSTTGLRTCSVCHGEITSSFIENTTRKKNGARPTPRPSAGNGPGSASIPLGSSGSEPEASSRTGASVRPPARWPSNICHDGSPEVLAAFATFGERKAATSNGRPAGSAGFTRGGGGTDLVPGYADTGTAARFFYSAKASKAERAGSKHPTVKPLALMRWLCRLVTPPGGLVLDMFAGTGVTGEAALLEGFSAVLVEREAEHVADIRRRLGRASGADTPLLSETAA